MIELVSVSPIGQGAIIVVAIVVLAVGLYTLYAVVERIVGDRIMEAIDDS